LRWKSWTSLGMLFLVVILPPKNGIEKLDH
jgi:hypothetical protein